MTNRQQWGIVAGIVAFFAVALGTATTFLGDELFPVTVGTDAPSFDALTLAEPPVRKTLADYRGEVVLLNIWATWCGPCRVEMPSLQALHDSLGGRGLRIVAVSVDEPGKAEAIRAFAADYGLTFEILHDPTKRIRQIYQTTGVPETFVIGRDGTIRKKVIAADDWNSPANHALLTRLLERPR